MTSRERWILYPLLFLTLGTVMRDKFFVRGVPINAREINAQRLLTAREIHVQRILCDSMDVGGKVECGEVGVIGRSGKDMVRIGVLQNGGGRLELHGPDGKILVAAGSDETGKAGAVETFDSEGLTQTRLWSHQCGGRVTTVSADRKTGLTMGYFGHDYGLFAESVELGRRMLLSLPWRLDTKAEEP